MLRHRPAAASDGRDLLVWHAKRLWDGARFFNAAYIPRSPCHARALLSFLASACCNFVLIPTLFFVSILTLLVASIACPAIPASGMAGRDAIPRRTSTDSRQYRPIDRYRCVFLLGKVSRRRLRQVVAYQVPVRS